MPRALYALTLEETIKATVSTHPAIQSQLAQLDASLSDVQTARQQFYPTPSVSVEQVSSSAGDWQYGQKSTVQAYRLQQPLWTGGRLTAGLDKAQANPQAAQQAPLATRLGSASTRKQATFKLKLGMAASVDIQTGSRSVRT